MYALCRGLHVTPFTSLWIMSGTLLFILSGSLCRFISMAVLLPVNLTSNNVSNIMKEQVGCDVSEETDAGAETAAAAVRSQPVDAITYPACRTICLAL